MSDEKGLSIQKINHEVELELSNKESFATLIHTTFKKLDQALVKPAMLEGMLRGFTLKDFLEGNIYAIQYGSGYNLVTSIDYSRKIGQRSGIVGKDAPVFVEKDDNIISCSVTVHKRQKDGYIGDFTSLVYFAEYTTNQNQWKSKPRTMIAKVAEMHALRMACPEELAQSYVEEEFEKKDTGITGTPIDAFDPIPYQLQLEGTGTTEDLIKVYAGFPGKAKAVLFDLKEKLKAEYAKKGI
jgi:RecT family